MSDLFRADRSTEIRLILAVHTALLGAQNEQSRQLSATSNECGGLKGALESLDRTITNGFAELNGRIEEVTQLARQLAGQR